MLDKDLDGSGEVSDEHTENLLIDLYLLADRLVDPITANLAIDNLINVIEVYNQYYSVALVQRVYKSTTEASPLRKLILDHHLDGDPNTKLADWLKGESFPSEFIRDLLFEVFAINKVNAREVIDDVYCSKPLQSSKYHQDVNKIRTSASEEDPATSLPSVGGPPPRRLERPVNSGTVVLKRYVHPLCGKRPVLTLICSPQQANKWWSVSQETFDNASMSHKHRYTSVANAMESGTVKTPACANCVRRAANGLEDLADCKAVAGGRCGRCLWGRVPLTEGCPKP
jgi:hypothetical protein